MKRKNYLLLLVILIVAILNVGFASCSKNDSNDELEPTENVSSQDPEGTIVLNMEGGASGNYYKIGELGEIHVDAANNFRGYDRNNYKIEFVTIGKVDGLSKISKIPTSGWAESAAVVPGTGYMMRYYPSSYNTTNPQYARIYVVDYLSPIYTNEMGNTYGGTTGATIKYQSPLQQKISLDNSSLVFTNTGNVNKSIKLKTPTHLSVKEKPEWCYVTTYVDSVRITVSENFGDTRKGDVILSNAYGEATISISQGAIAAISFEKASLSFTNKASTQSVKLKTPTYYEIEEKPSWCTIQTKVDSITISVEENKDKARTGNIVVKNAIGKATIQVNQESYPAISLEKTSLTFSSAASSQIVKLNTQTSSEVSEKPDWCSVRISLDSIVVGVEENVSASQRTGIIVLKNAVSTTNLSVTQKASSSPLFEKGIGTKENPYQIQSAQQLANINKALNSHFILTSDINLKSYLYEYGNGWEPIPNFAGSFKGSLDGMGHTISGLWIKRPNLVCVGLFSAVDGATISNVKIEIDVNGINGKAEVGAICGYAGAVTINNCSVSGNVIGNGDYVGGFCGIGNNIIITNCNYNGNVTGKDETGGLLGSGIDGNIYQCWVNGTIIGGNYTGGLVGFSNSPLIIMESKSEGSISSTGNNTTSAGIVACCQESGVSITNCYSLASLSGYNCYGISFRGEKTRCYFAGKVSTQKTFSCEGSYTYFDSTVSGIMGSNGYNTENMMKQATYESWDFMKIWKITEGKTYPTLRCFDK